MLSLYLNACDSNSLSKLQVNWIAHWNVHIPILKIALQLNLYYLSLRWTNSFTHSHIALSERPNYLYEACGHFTALPSSLCGYFHRCSIVAHFSNLVALVCIHINELNRINSLFAEEKASVFRECKNLNIPPLNNRPVCQLTSNEPKHQSIVISNNQSSYPPKRYRRIFHYESEEVRKCTVSYYVENGKNA